LAFDEPTKSASFLALRQAQGEQFSFSRRTTLVLSLTKDADDGRKADPL